MTSKFSNENLTDALQQLSGWAKLENRDAICKNFKFKSFRQAFSFMTELALVAEKMDHHPEWSNVYSRVEIILTTHSAGGVTELDIAFAKAADLAATS